MALILVPSKLNFIIFTLEYYGYLYKSKESEFQDTF